MKGDRTDQEWVWVYEAVLGGFEEHYTIGIYTDMPSARSAAARAMMEYRRYHREKIEVDEDGYKPKRPRKPNLWPRVYTHPLNTYLNHHWNDKE